MDIRKKRVAQVLIAAISGVFIWYGASRGEMGIVLSKAVNICLECIGLG